MSAVVLVPALVLALVTGGYVAFELARTLWQRCGRELLGWTDDLGESGEYGE